MSQMTRLLEQPTAGFLPRQLRHVFPVAWQLQRCRVQAIAPREEGLVVAPPTEELSCLTQSPYSQNPYFPSIKWSQKHVPFLLTGSPEDQMR